MKEENSKNVTNEQLAELINNLRGQIKDIKAHNSSNRIFNSIIKSSIEKLDEKIGGVRVELSDFRTEMKDVKTDIEQLTKGALTEDEKDEVLNMVRNIDERLEEETLGKDKITLNRNEYDNVANTVGFANKFEKVS